MINCASCGTANMEGSQFCDQCGATLKTTASLGGQNGGEMNIPQGEANIPRGEANIPQMVTPIPAYVPPAQASAPAAMSDDGPETGHPGANVTSLGGLLPSDPSPVAPAASAAPIALETVLAVAGSVEPDDEAAKNVHAKLIIERGSAVGTEFSLSTNEAYIGRWDADNGIFPDIDLDAHDPEAKVSRRHARVILKDESYSVEDLGSTNGTFINRGRRLLPGNPHILKDGDEIIVGKTFLRFHAIR